MKKPSKPKGKCFDRNLDPTVNLTERADNDEDPFCLLPDELVITIFHKVADVKCLFQCSLVSKHFASIITRVRTVSLTISCTRISSRVYFQRTGELLGKLYYCSSEQIPSLLDSFALHNMKLPNFLQNLRELEFIYLDYEFPESGVVYPFPNLKVTFSNKLERFVAVMARYVYNDTENESTEEQHADDNEEESTRMEQYLSYFNVRYVEWLCLVIILVKRHILLKRVTLTDAEFNAKLVIGDGQLVNKALHMVKGMVNLVSYKMAIVRVPVLRLPLSGYVCRWTTIVIASAPDDPLLSFENVDDIIDRDFEEKLMVLRESIKVIIKNYRNKIALKQLKSLFMEVPSMK